MAYQQGIVPLVPGTTEYDVVFPIAFSGAPSLVHAQPFRITGDIIVSDLDIEITYRDATGFSFITTINPPSSDYTVSWLAGSTTVSLTSTDGGISLASLPEHQGDIPDNTLMSVVLPGKFLRTRLVRWISVRNNLAANHTHTLAQISNATPFGRLLLAAVSKSAARNLLEAAAAVHTHVATDISNSTAIGRNVLTGASAGAIRTTIDAAQTVHTHAATSVSDSTAVGRALMTAVDATAGRTAISAAAATHTHDATDLNIATALKTALDTAVDGPTFINDLGGLVAGDPISSAQIVAGSHVTTFLTSSTVALAQAAVEAMPVTGWHNTTLAISTDSTFSSASFGRKIVVSGSRVLTINTSTTSGIFGKTLYYVPAGNALTFLASGTTLLNETGGSLGGSYSAGPGVYMLERLQANVYAITAAWSADVKSLLNSANLAAFKTTLAFDGTDLDVESFIQDFLATSTKAEALAAIGASPSSLSIENVNASGNFAGMWGTSPANTLFVCTGQLAITMDSITGMVAGESFSIHAATAGVTIVGSSAVEVNPLSDYSTPVVIPEGATVEFTYVGDFSLKARLLADLKYQAPVSKTLWVSVDHGNNLTAIKGRQDMAYSTLLAAATAAVDGDTIIVTPGTYAASTNLLLSNAAWVFQPGAVVNFTATGTYLFNDLGTAKTLDVTGDAVFNLSNGQGRLVSLTGTASGGRLEARSVSSSTNNTVGIFGFAGAYKTFTAKIKETINCPYNALVVSTGSGINFNINLTDASAVVGSFATATAGMNVSILGGDLTCETDFMSGTGGGSAYVQLAFKGQRRIYSPNAVPITTSGPNVFVSISSCDHLEAPSFYIGPGPGRLFIKDSRMLGLVLLDSDNLCVMNSLIQGYNLDGAGTIHIVGTLTVDTEVLPTVTPSGGDIIFDDSMSNFIPYYS